MGALARMLRRIGLPRKSFIGLRNLPFQGSERRLMQIIPLPDGALI
jgi:hypothetical protein